MTFDFAVSSNAIPRTDLAQDASMLRPIPLREIFVFDSGALLPAAGTADDLGFYQTTHGTGFPHIQTGDVKAAGCVRKCRFTITLPPEYVAGGAIFIRARGGMVTTVADGDSIIDFAAYKAAGAVKTGSDLVETAATSINDLDWDDYDFAITGESLVPGDELDVLCTVTVTDAATVGEVRCGFRILFGCTCRG